MDNNAYLLQHDGDIVLVDAGNDAPTLIRLIAGRRTSTIVTTHRHADHLQALVAVAAATGARLVAGTPDVAAIEAATGLAVAGVWDGDVVRVGRAELAVISLVGHTPGSIALAYSPEIGPAQLIVGDCLFPGGVGKTSTKAGFTQLLDDVTHRLFDRFDDDAIVLPGHGSPTTLGAERPHLEEWRARGW
jgi:glyoxylase-like metal-dependent hydrolase (beta-lactamase superfamily II)